MFIWRTTTLSELPCPEPLQVQIFEFGAGLRAGSVHNLSAAGFTTVQRAVSFNMGAEGVDKQPPIWVLQGFIRGSLRHVLLWRSAVASIYSDNPLSFQLLSKKRSFCSCHLYIAQFKPTCGTILTQAMIFQVDAGAQQLLGHGDTWGIYLSFDDVAVTHNLWLIMNV